MSDVELEFGVKGQDQVVRALKLLNKNTKANTKAWWEHAKAVKRDTQATAKNTKESNRNSKAKLGGKRMTDAERKSHERNARAIDRETRKLRANNRERRKVGRRSMPSAMWNRLSYGALGLATAAPALAIHQVMQGGFNREGAAFQLKSLGEGQDNLDIIRRESERTGTDRTFLENQYVNLRRRGFDATMALQAVGIGEDLAVRGSAQTADSVMRAIAQMKAKGVLQMEELQQQLADAGVNSGAVVDLLAKQRGVSSAKIREMITKKEISADEGIPAVFSSILSQFGTTKPGEYAQQFADETRQGRFNKAMVKARNTFEDLAVKVLPAMDAGLSDFTDWLQSPGGTEGIKSALEGLVEEGGDLAGTVLPASVDALNSFMMGMTDTDYAVAESRTFMEALGNTIRKLNEDGLFENLGKAANSAAESLLLATETIGAAAGILSEKKRSGFWDDVGYLLEHAGGSSDPDKFTKDMNSVTASAMAGPGGPMGMAYGAPMGSWSPSNAATSFKVDFHEGAIQGSGDPEETAHAAVRAMEGKIARVAASQGGNR